ncbi:MAG: EscU/YscU/HrcU family type III secretion system export apparatus switch protein [Parvibaculales bacterium]
MAEENDAQEKTEQPSERKLEKAREEGRIVTSKEMFVFTSLFAGLIVMLGVLQMGGYGLSVWSELFTIRPQSELDTLIEHQMALVLKFVIAVTAIVGTPLMVIIVATQFAVGGLIFAPKAMAFKGSRINPVAGLKRMFSMKSLVELGKSLLKVLLLFGIGAAIIFYYMPGVIWFPDGSMDQALLMMGTYIPFMVGGLLVALLIIAILDFAWQRYSFMKEMRMSRQDMKEEFKQTEGSPEVKAKIRRLQMEAAGRAAQQREALSNIDEATAIITNPTHFAVALKYEVGSPGAPIIVAMGRGVMAQQIISRGEECEVTVFRSPLLARALYFTGDIGQEISERLYNAVAVVLGYIYRIDQGDQMDAPEVDLPPDLRFSEHGRVLEEY